MHATIEDGCLWSLLKECLLVFVVVCDVLLMEFSRDESA